ncbi:MAG TPA: flavodoxin family protein [Firmicutes bacterium]|nr:flavodoxin family protein [Bacillota bacterium]
MGKILIVYYTRTGNTERMARLVEKGARQEGAEVVVQSVQETKPEDLLKYDALIFGSPTYYGTMAHGFKRLIDTSVDFHGQLEGKVGAAFSSSANIGGGNESTVLSLLQAFLIHGMVVQGDPEGDHYGPVSVGEPDERAAIQCERLGLRVARLVRQLKGED